LLLLYNFVMVLLLDFPKCDCFHIHLDFVILYGSTEGKINDMIPYDTRIFHCALDIILEFRFSFFPENMGGLLKTCVWNLGFYEMGVIWVAD
jgi:hypothetical protein